MNPKAVCMECSDWSEFTEKGGKLLCTNCYPISIPKWY